MTRDGHAVVRGVGNDIADRDLVAACTWAALGADRGYEPAAEQRARLESRLTDGQRLEVALATRRWNEEVAAELAPRRDGTRAAIPAW